MKTTTPKSSPESIVPAVHLEFIQNHLQNPTASGLESVEQYHRSLFLHHHAVEWEKYRQQARIHEDRIAFLEDQLKNTDLGLRSEEHTSELQSLAYLVCRLLLEKKKNTCSV